MQTLDAVRLAATLGAFATSVSKLAPATLPFWEKRSPMVSRWAPGLILVLGALPASLTGVTTWEQFALAVLGACAFALPGTHKNLAAPLKGPPVGEERVSLRPPPKGDGYGPDDMYPFEGAFPPPSCRACGRALLPENRTIADGCPCNAPRGINHGLVAKNTCTCRECDPKQTGGTRIKLPPTVAMLCLVLGLVSCGSAPPPRPCSANDPQLPAKLADCKLRMLTECKDVEPEACAIRTECRAWVRDYCGAAQ